MKFTLKPLAVVLLLSSPLAHAGRVYIREDPIKDSYIVMFKGNVPEGMSKNLKGEQVLSVKQLGKIAEEYGATVTDAWTALVSGFAVEMPEEAAIRLADHSLVDYVETQVMTYPVQSTTWGIDRIDQRELPLDGEFNPLNSGSGVTSYIIDSGVRISHQEFQGRAEWGTNIIDDNDTDCSGHGTHVAGTVAGAMYGVGKKTKIVAVKIFPCSGGTPSSNTIAAMNWVAEDAATNPDTPATCNMSVTGGLSYAVNDAAAALVDSGVVTVAAAGNWAQNACNYSPGSEPKVITVGSTTDTDAKSWFSNHGNCVDIFAPGSSITSAWYTSDSATSTNSGTSMASPHVAGVAGLALRAGVPPENVIDELINFATVDVITNLGPSSPNLLLFSGNVIPTVSPAPSIHFPSAEPSTSYAPSGAPSNTYAPSGAPTECPNDLLEVIVFTDSEAYETSWVLEDTCSIQYMWSRSTFAADTLHEDIICGFSADSIYRYRIFDSFQDGICCTYGEGFYEVRLNGDVVASGGVFGGVEETVFGADECPPCEGDSITITIVPDWRYWEIGYTLEDDCTEEVLFQRPEGSLRYDLNVDQICASNSGGAYTFTITDSIGGGICCSLGEGFYEVVKNGILVASGGDFGFSEATSFGSCVPTVSPAPSIHFPSAEPSNSPAPSNGPCVDSNLPVPFDGTLYNCASIVYSDGCSNPIAASHCPLGCDACDAYACEDSEAPWYLFGNTYDCGMLAALETEVIETYCIVYNFIRTCRATCGFC